MSKVGVGAPSTPAKLSYLQGWIEEIKFFIQHLLVESVWRGEPSPTFKSVTTLPVFRLQQVTYKERENVSPHILVIRPNFMSPLIFKQQFYILPLNSTLSVLEFWVLSGVYCMVSVYRNINKYYGPHSRRYWSVKHYDTLNQLPVISV